MMPFPLIRKKTVYKLLREKDIAETAVNAIKLIVGKQYEAELLSAGFVSERIREYGFAFQGKECLTGIESAFTQSIGRGIGKKTKEDREKNA